MTIEEAKEIEANPKEYSKWKLSDAQKFRRAWAKGYEAKEEELKGALIIPKGWELNEAGSWDTTHWVQLWNKKEEVLFTGKSDDNYDEALRNALEQITTK